jgi:hypothetical protein
MKNLKLAAFVFLLGLEVFAMESIGRVVKVHGEVMNHQDGSSQSLKRGDHLYVGANITSGKGSFVKIFMKDDTIFQLGPNSEFSLEKFEFKTKSERTAVYNLAKGKLRSLFTVKAPTRSLKIKTPTASMGVRGTEILSDVYKFKGKLTTDIALLSGSLEIQTKGIQKRMLIKPGFVYQSSLSKSLKKNAISSKIRRMDKRVFSRARMSKGVKNVFLTDVRRNVDKKLVKDVKFDVKKVDDKKSRLPASEKKIKIEKKKPKIKDIKPMDRKKTSLIKIKPALKKVDISKVNMKSRDFSKMRKAAILKRIQTGTIQNNIDRTLASPPPPPPTDIKNDYNTRPAGSAGTFQ